MDDRQLIVPSYMGSAPVAAMHGYDPATKGSQALLLSNRPLPAGLAHVVDFRAFFGQELAARETPRLEAAGSAR